MDPFASTPIRDRTTSAILERNVATHPDKTAVVEIGGRSLTYAQLQREAYGLAAGLRNLEIGRQDHVLVMLGNHVDRAVTFLGITVGAMVDVPINTAFKGESLIYICELSGASVLFIEAEWCDRLEFFGDRAPHLKTIVVHGETSATIPDRFTRVDYEALSTSTGERPDPPEVWDICSMMFTSGTTGRSKGVLCPHGHVFSMSSFPALSGGADEVVLVVLPMFHAMGLLSGVNNAWRAGGTAILASWFTASGFWDQVREYGCTTTLLTGAQTEFMWRQPPSPGDSEHPLRLSVTIPALSNGAAFSERFGIELVSGYGLTESGTVITGGSETPRLSSGKSRPGYDVRIVDDHDTEVAPGTTGEIVMRSIEPWSLMSGYHKMPEETAAAWRNLWLHSGDAGFMDDAGNLFYVDRAKDALRRRGENVSSFEVEQHILAHDDVNEVAVVAVPSADTEDEIMAVLVLAPGVELDPVGLMRDLYQRMPYFMMPRYLKVVDELPRTPTMKVRKVELRAAGVSESTWDAEAAGVRVTRSALIEPAPAVINAQHS